MNILERIRCSCFWMVDSIKGGKIKNHLKEIEKIQKEFLSDDAQALLKDYTKNLLAHATSTTDFYKDFEGLDLDKFPVINKNVFRENETQFQSKTFIEKENKLVSSSGSTGTTIRLFHDKNKSLRNTADNIYFHNLTGFEVGEKLFYIRIWWYKIQHFAMWCKNVKAIDILKFNDKQYISNLIDELTSGGEEKSIIGYASALEKMCVYLDNNNSEPFKNPKIKSVIAISESLSNYTKEKIKYYFKTSVYSRYSNSENGIIAQQVPNSGNDFIINWASYYIEILKFDQDVPADSGEVGRIVITDLFNYVMPLIRYDTGDVGSIDYSTVPPTFKRIEGRRSDIIYDTSGEIVSSLIIVRPHLSKGVLQSQLIQENKKEYTIVLNVTEDFDEEDTIISTFKEILGNDAVITIKYTKQIPTLASGKTKATINNYNP